MFDENDWYSEGDEGGTGWFLTGANEDEVAEQEIAWQKAESQRLVELDKVNRERNDEHNRL